MLTSVITEEPDLLQFLESAAERLGDPSLSMCLVFVRYQETAANNALGMPTLLATYDAAVCALTLEALDEMAKPTMHVTVPLSGEEDPAMARGQMSAFGMRKVARGLWALNPSLNLPGEFHGYVVVHGVPDPAPWERLVLLASEVQGGMAFGGGR